ncbi:hypothetical protein GCM10008995_24640 [Halobellus salinus]|uniref:PIN domain-containing protein n=1 Tax=Halobellus salinus TaxID=931585 RepID=A0A830ER93_9EURY|nr:hypothetical protein [Halobellus salinus]GGJ13835.1 hypothetical protein GCM10008995_24640 [Halobellus salinus]
MILDTAFVLDLLGGDEGAVRKAEELEESGAPMRLPAMTVTELYIGIGTGVAAVAAAAEREGEPVLTRHIEDFEKLGVAVESY